MVHASSAIREVADIMPGMAAAQHAGVPELAPLKSLRAEDLDPVLDEEALAWRSLLRWDFAASAELVRRFLKIHALAGYALISGGRVVGYSYYVCEERKGLIGDLFLSRDFAATQNEDHLLGAVLNDLVCTPHLQRIEAQLMLLHGPFERPMPLGGFSQVFPRIFMLADLSDAQALPPSGAAVQILPWDERRQDEAAQLIAGAYQGHVDSQINDQYRSFAGARRFLMNIVQYPGCGKFFHGGSFMAEDGAGRIVGLILSSHVADDVGHVTQVCVSPEMKGRGVGYELMRSAMNAMVNDACERASLTVTASNTGAIQLYQRLGYRSTRRFAAYVWDGF
jgi:ribosomal protein S18 acetylase RimI-like enzyme